jgi:type II secretory pathway component GspD/PulD (secretin)
MRNLRLAAAVLLPAGAVLFAAERGREQAGSVNPPSPAERLVAGLSRSLTVEFNETSLAEAVATVSEMARLNIAIAPKVREQKLKVTFRAEKMEAACVLRWMAQLTGTHLIFLDNLLYFTDEVPKEAASQERLELLIMLIANRVDPAVLPPEGVELTEEHLLKIARELYEKTHPPQPDFPAPSGTLFDWVGNK